MRKIIFAGIFVTICSVCYAQVSSSKDLYLTKAFKEASFKKINAETSHGNIIVSDVLQTETRVEVYVHSGNSNIELSKEEIQRKLDEYYALDVSLSGDVVNAVARRKKDFPEGQTSLNISFRIYAPRSMSTELKTSHGNVEVSGMAGSQEILTDHGNIDVEEITGKLTAQTSHGNISVTGSKDDLDIKTDHGNVEVKNCEGTVKLVSSSGNLILNHVKGKVHASTDHGNVAGNTIEGGLSVSTSHGDVDLEKLSCSVEASTDHGNIAVSVDKIAGDIVLDNSSGNISVQLPKGKGIDLDLRGKSVNVDAIENFSGSKEKNSIKGSLNGGGTKVNAKTDKGQVSLTFK